MRIRLATESDLPIINDIYNHYVLTCTCTYQEEPSTAAERLAWFQHHDAVHPVTVAEMDGQVVAWGSLSPFHPRAAYRFTVENSVYVHRDFQRRGLGKALLADLITRAQAAGHHSIVALISADQTASLKLHAAHGFTQVALLKEVGFKFNRWLDVAYMQRML